MFKKLIKKFENANDINAEGLTVEQIKAEIVRLAYQAITDEELESMFSE